jgi:hypothetical protein
MECQTRFDTADYVRFVNKTVFGIIVARRTEEGVHLTIFRETRAKDTSVPNSTILITSRYFCVRKHRRNNLVYNLQRNQVNKENAFLNC